MAVNFPTNVGHTPDYESHCLWLFFLLFFFIQAKMFAQRPPIPVNQLKPIQASNSQIEDIFRDRFPFFPVLKI